MGGLHGSDVELHVGGVDLQELKQQGLSNLVGSDRGFISFEYEGMHLNVRLIILELLEQC